MQQGIGLIVYPVNDLARSKAVYGALTGVEPYVDEAYYVGFKVGGQEIGLDPNGQARGMTAPVGFWEVGDVRQSLAALLAAGATVQEEVRDVGGGKLVASVRDVSGNVIGLMQSC